jgi:hypothetical protein
VLFMFLGPVSSASPKGQGPFFSGLFILIGSWMLVRTWMDYLKARVGREIPPFNILGITGLAVFFIGAGVWGFIH